jgi:signal transduction histidine kinase
MASGSQSGGGSGSGWPQILSLVGHQLRGPTSLISGYVEMLASDEVRTDPNRLNQVLEEIRANVRELNRLTTELQTGSRAAEGPLPIRHQHMPIDSLIDDVVRSAVPLCRQRHVTLDYDRAHRDGSLIGDPFYLKICLLNLIDNAAKYGKPSGRVQLRTQLLGQRIEFDVIDQGPGLGPRAPELFVPFAQGPAAIEGIGLGLTLVKAIVEAHGGAMVWWSGHTSSVGFTLPWSQN